MVQETRKRVVEVRCPVTVPREIGSLSRMNDDRTNIIVSQQRRDLVFGDWTSAALASEGPIANSLTRSAVTFASKMVNTENRRRR